MGSARSLEAGEMPQGIQRLWSQFQETSIYKTTKMEIDSMMSQYPEDYQALKQVVSKVKDTLAKDFEKQCHKLMQLRKPQQIINWIINHMNFVSITFVLFLTKFVEYPKETDTI